LNGGAAGTSLLEVVAAVAIASLLASAAGRQAYAALGLLTIVEEAAAATTAARNLLEEGLATPCGAITAPSACPERMECSLRSAVVAVLPDAADGTLIRISVVVVSLDEPQRTLAAMSVLTATSGVCARNG
jgi:Tfp pilus assembly protein PilE